MAVRDISPTAWNAPCVSRIGFSAIQPADTPDPIPLDVWISNYSFVVDEITNLSSGFNQVLFDDTNVRVIVIIPPNGNTASITVKGLTGDTGVPVHPDCPIVISVPAATPPPYIGITCGADITGVRLLFM